MKVMVVLLLQYGKNGHEIPSFLPLFPRLGRRFRAEAEPVPLGRMPAFTHLDEFMVPALRKVRREWLSEVATLHRDITSIENKSATLFHDLARPPTASKNSTDESTFVEWDPLYLR